MPYCSRARWGSGPRRSLAVATSARPSRRCPPRLRAYWGPAAAAGTGRAGPAPASRCNPRRPARLRPCADARRPTARCPRDPGRAARPPPPQRDRGAVPRGQGRRSDPCAHARPAPGHRRCAQGSDERGSGVGGETVGVSGRGSGGGTRGYAARGASRAAQRQGPARAPHLGAGSTPGRRRRGRTTARGSRSAWSCPRP